METVVYALPFRFFSAFILLGWSAAVGWKAVFPASFPRFSGRFFVGISFVLFITIRLLYLPDREQNVDTSTWIATALTVGQADDPVYTLFNYSDGRPLAVLPLVLVECLGVPLDYRLTDFVGVLLWCITLGLFGRIIRKDLSAETAPLLVWLPILLLSTVWEHDFASFNTEVTGNLWLVLGLFWLVRLPTQSVLAVLGLGFWLGCLPFVKFQTVPMGLVFGLYAAWKCYRDRRFAALLGLLTGAVLPVLLLAVFYAAHHDLESFWGDYFSNYFVYSYTSEYSDLSPWERFSPVRIGRYLFHSYKIAFYWIGIFGGILAGFGFLSRAAGFLKPERKERLGFGLIWLAASFYAALQAGNTYPHYLLFLLLPSLFVLAVLCAGIGPDQTRLLLPVCLVVIAGQAVLNTVYRKPLSRHPGEPLFQQLTTEIQNCSQPHERLVLWGYLDRLHVSARRPMGYRNSNAFWVYYPTSTRPFRMQEFLRDLDRNKPRLFVDVMSPRIAMFADEAFRFEKFPAIDAYIQRHYRLVKTVEEVRIFERKPAKVTD
ncbi:hypothetical protein GCM10027299_28430 [Larkinella ripae]